MLAFERWTLTQSSGWAAVLVGLELALALALGLLPGLAAMNASRVAETVAAGELCDDGRRRRTRLGRRARRAT